MSINFNNRSGLVGADSVATSGADETAKKVADETAQVERERLERRIADLEDRVARLEQSPPGRLPGVRRGEPRRRHRPR